MKQIVENMDGVLRTRRVRYVNVIFSITENFVSIRNVLFTELFVKHVMIFLVYLVLWASITILYLLTVNYVQFLILIAYNVLMKNV